MFRNEVYIIEDDNQVLILPSRVESVKKLEVFNTNLGIQRITGIENYIDKNCYINGCFNQECKDYVIDRLLIEIKKFKKF